MDCRCSSSGSPERNKLVVCIDGTSNQFGPKNTNVVELYSQIVKSPSQLTYYNSGVGTYAKPSWRSWSYYKQVLANKVDLAIAWNFQKTVMAAYRWLSENYQPDDCIYLFGFSRGAYQVRALAGMIHKVGLIHKGNEDQIPFAYELYEDKKSTEYSARRPKSLRGDSNKQRINLAERFKTTFSRKNVQVHFVGVWDTVSSIGIVRGKCLPLTETVDHVCFFRHALALDERRVKFLPEYGSNRQDEEAQPEGQKAFPARPVAVKEVWFPGTHSDIGGGNLMNPNLDLGQTPVLWMSFEAISCGLSLSPSKVNWDAANLRSVEESLTSIWHIFEWIPFKRLTYKNHNPVITYRLHRGRGRKMMPGQKIHASVAFYPNDYQPRAKPPPGLSQWEELVNKGERDHMHWAMTYHDILEMDMFDISTANSIVERLSSKPGDDYELWLHRMAVLTRFNEGRSALLKAKAAALLRSLLTTGLDSAQIHAEKALTAYYSKTQSLDVLEMIIYTIDHSGDARARSLGGRCLTQIPIDEPGQDKLLQNGTLKAISQLLLTEDYIVLRETLSTFGVLLRHENYQPSADGHSDKLRKTLLLNSMAMAAEKTATNDSSTVDVQITAKNNSIEDVQLSANDNSTEDVQTPANYVSSINIVVDAVGKMLRSGDVLDTNSAVDLLSIAAMHNDLRETLWSDALIKTVGAMLGETAIIQNRALRVLSIAAVDDDLRTRQFEAITAGKIQKMLSDSSDRDCALDLLSIAAGHEDLQTDFFALDMVTAIQKPPSNASWLAEDKTLTLLTIAVNHKDLCTRLFAAVEVDTIVEMLCQTATLDKNSALRFLSIAAKDRDLRARLFDDRIAEAVGKMISEESVRDCASDLLFIATKHEDIRSRIFGEEVIAAIQKMLRDGSQSDRDCALKLVSMTKGDDVLLRRQFDAILVDMVQGMLRRSEQAELDCALELLSIAADHKDLRIRLFEGIVVEAIPEMLSSSGWLVRKRALKLLSMAASHKDLRAKFLKAAFMRTTEKMLSTSQWSIWHYVLQLLSISANGGCFDGVMVETMVKKHGSSDELDRNTSLKLLSIATKYEGLRTTTLDDVVVQVIRVMLSVGEWAVFDQALELLSISATRAAVVTQEQLGDDFAFPKDNLLDLLHIATNHKDLHSRLFDSILLAVIQKSKIPERGFRLAAPKLLKIAAGHKDFRTKLLDRVMRQAIQKMLDSSDQSILNCAIQLLSIAAKNNDLRIKLFDDRTKAGIVGRLSSTESNRASVLELLSIVATHGVAILAHADWSVEDLHARLFDDATKFAIKKRLNSDELDKAAALELLSIAASQEKLGSMLFDDDLEKITLTMLKNSEPSTLNCAFQLLSIAATNATLCTSWFKKKTRVAIEKRLSSTESDRASALELLSIAGTHGDPHKDLFDQDMMLAILKIQDGSHFVAVFTIFINLLKGARHH